MHPCTFLNDVFAGQTRYFIEQSPSLAILMRLEPEASPLLSPYRFLAKKFSSRIVKKCTSCTFFNSKFVKQTCYCVEPRTSCPIVVVPPFFQKYPTPHLHILPVRFRRNGRLTQRPQLLNLAGKSGMDAAGSTQQRRLRLRLKLVDEKCTRMYIFHQGRFTPFV